eukprot:1148773-Amphidinium_carterae.1
MNGRKGRQHASKDGAAARLEEAGAKVEHPNRDSVTSFAGVGVALNSKHRRRPSTVRSIKNDVRCVVLLMKVGTVTCQYLVAKGDHAILEMVLIVDVNFANSTMR